MEPRQNYFAVGLFVVIGIVGTVLAGLWAAGTGDSRNYNLYQTYFTESVTGLDEGTAVKYRGVNVGSVKQIHIDSDDITRIRVVMKIEKETPMRVDTVAVLRTVGITGIPYVQLEGGSRDSAPLVPSSDNKIPTIPSMQSQMTQLVNAIPQILGNLSTFADKLAKIVEGDGGKQMADTFANINKAAASFGETSASMNAALADVRAAMTQFRDTAATIEATAADSRGDLKKSLEQSAAAMEKLNALLEKTNKFSETSYPQMQATLVELKRTTRDIGDLTRSLKQNPAQLIAPPKTGGVSIP